MFGRYKTKYELDRVQDFSVKNSFKLTGIEATVQNTIETININIKWMDLHFEAVDRWLKENTGFFKVSSSDFIEQSYTIAFDSDVY